MKYQISDREYDVLQLIAREYTTPEIAAQLYISCNTVISHRRNLLKKLQAKNIAGLMVRAMRSGALSF